MRRRLSVPVLVVGLAAVAMLYLAALATLYYRADAQQDDVATIATLETRVADLERDAIRDGTRLYLLEQAALPPPDGNPTIDGDLVVSDREFTLYCAIGDPLGRDVRPLACFRLTADAEDRYWTPR